jgi:A/G-specific adenine glycosylase
MDLPSIAVPLVRWQRVHGRHGLPWQATRDPYRVWLSEVMLQQTQVVTVLGYFDRFLQRFPDVAALAAAPLDDVLALWSGLGYYSRARNLHRCAQAVVAEHGGRFPPTAMQLQTLPGIGPSTAAAVASFCFGERVSIFDGNVKRVLARVLAFDGDLAEARANRTLWALADRLVPDTAAYMPAYTQGLMDLGATVCTPREPACADCPLRPDCHAHATGRQHELPRKSRTLKRSARSSWALWLSVAGHTWLQQRPPQGIWSGLWAWPLLDDAAALDALTNTLLAASGAAAAGLQAERLAPFEHVLTHLDWTFHLHRLSLPAVGASEVNEPIEHADAPLLARLDTLLNATHGPGRWHADADLVRLGLPAPLRKHFALV